MIIKGFVLRSPWKSRGFFVIFLLFSTLFFSNTSYSQSAEAEANFAVCKACHTIGGGKLIGPDLAGVTERREEAWLINFIKNSQAMIDSGDPIAVQVWEEYNKIPMPPNPQLSDDQIRDILKYIENGGKVAGGETTAQTEADTTTATADEKGISEASEEKLVQMEWDAARNLQTTFIAMMVLIVISLFDLLISKIVKWRWIHAVIILISVAIAGEVVFFEATALGRQQYYQPDQPIWFSHKVHSGQNKIDCMYCHFTADKSQHAGIPPVQVCLNCHNQVKEGKITGTKEIDKIHEAYNSGKPIEWVKVHNLPDHVYFNHAQHVNVGKVACNDCHGVVEEMDVIIQVEDLSMGWCIECHRTNEVQFTSNKFYSHYTELHKELKEGIEKRITVDDIGGTDCQKCHY